ncbi:MAG: FHA domain-containing protein [Gammaproteobacteria bacterium]
MTALAIDINDAGIAVADATGVLGVEPGFAVVDRGRILTGDEAVALARLRPRQASNRFWNSLSLESGSAGADLPSAAELAHAQLAAIWQKTGQGRTDVLLVVPAGYRSEQLGMLLGLAQECGMPVRALVDVAAAAGHRPYLDRELVYLDAGLYRVTATVLEQGADVAVRAEHALLQSGLNGLMDAFARRIADAFVRATRFNPFRDAETEQALYDRLPGWLDAWCSEEQLELKLPYGGDDARVTVEREEVLRVAAGFYRGVAQLVAQSRESDRGLVVLVSDRLARLPGLVGELARIDDARIEVLEKGHAARSALLATPQANGAEVKLLKRLPWRAAPALVEAAAGRAPLPSAAASQSRATHVVHGGTAYRVGAGGLVVGREIDAARRTIMVPDNHSGVSRVHAELQLRDGELKVRDLSRYGTYVNEKKVAGEVVLQPGDVVRVGSPGIELRAVVVEAAE